MQESDRVVGLLAEQYQYAASGKDQLNLLRQWQLAERFWQADQWPAGTPASFPKPVLNIVHEHVERKVAAVTNQKPRITYKPRRPDTDPESKKVLDQAADYTADRVRLLEVFDDIARTAALMGTGIAQTAFNPAIQGGSEKYGDLWQGDLEVREIDPENFFPLDPVERDVQQQPGVIVAEDMFKDDVQRAYAKHAEKLGTNIDELAAEGFTGDAWTRNYPQENLRRQNTIFVVKSWWREKGKLNHAVAAQGKLLRHSPGIYEHGKYPFSVMRWYKRRKSFWGLSEFAQLLPNQQSINRLLGFLLMSAELTGMPQKRVKYGALKPGTWTGEPGLILTDMSGQQGWGVDYLQPPSAPAYIPNLLQGMLDNIRRQQGLMDALSGQAPSAQLNATAIAYLQQAAMVLLEPIIGRANMFLEDIGRLFYAFWTEPNLFSTGRIIKGMEFRGSDFVDEEFDVEIETGGTNFWDEQAQVTLIKEYVPLQIITPEEALMATPEGALPQKEQILQKRQQQAEQEAALGVMNASPGAAQEQMLTPGAPQTAAGQQMAEAMAGPGGEAALGGGGQVV